MKEQIDINDFVIVEPTTGRHQLSRVRRALLDMLCAQTGHLLWRIQGSVRDNPEGSLPLAVSVCRRCGQGGYVRGDYYRG